MFTHEDQTNMFTDHVLLQGANSNMISCNTKSKARKERERVRWETTEMKIQNKYDRSNNYNKNMIF